MSLQITLATLAACLGQPDPGTVVVVGSDLALATFNLNGSAEYQVDFPTGSSAPSRVWRDSAATLPAAPFTTYIASVLGDLDSNGSTNGRDIPVFVSALLAGSFNPGGDFNHNGILDAGDIPGFATCLVGMCPPSGVMLYVEGVNASQSLGDAAIDFYTDPDLNSVFTLADTEPVTVVNLTFGPLTGRIGTPVSITMTPALPPLAFASPTTAQWTGVFQPLIGSPTPQFSIGYSAGQFHESNGGSAVLLVGDGSVSSPPAAGSLEGVGGSLAGRLSVMIGSSVVSKTLNFSPEFDGAVWRAVDYPDGPGGAYPPVLGQELSELPTMLLSNSPDPQNPSEELLLAVAWAHVAAVYLIDENPTTTANAPNTIHVDLVSYDAGGVEVDRVHNLELTKVTGDDEDPNHIVYHNDLLTPIVLVDVPLEQESYPDAILLTLPADGSAVIVPSAN